MGYSDFTQIPVGPNPIQVCPPLGKGETVTLYNQDIANIVYVSRSISFTLGSGVSIPIQPLTSAVLSASAALYAVAPPNTAQLVIIPEANTLSPSPAQIAAQISLSGINSSAPKFIQTLGTFAAGAAWGPINVTLPNGGAYAITVSAAANIGGTDITIDHLDINGTIVYEEFFGAVATSGFGVGTPTTVRGNVQGVSLRIKGQVCPIAFFTNISGIVGSAQPVTLNVYSLPFALANDVPKVISAGFNQVATSAAGLILSVDGVAVASGVTTQAPLMQPYAGPVTVSFRVATPLTVAANGRLNLAFWSAAQFINAGTALGTVRFMTTGAFVEDQSTYNLPCAYCNAALANTDPSLTGTFFAHITAGAFA